MPDDIAAKMTRFVSLSNTKRELRAALDDTTTELAAIQLEILDYWQAHGITQQRVQGLTVYPHTDLYASAPLDAVRAAGLEELIGVSSQKLSAYVREQRAAGEPLPTPLEAAVKITERTSLRTRKGS